MDQVLSIVIVMNNYFHDVATAVLLASAVIMGVLVSRARTGAPGALAALGSARPLLTRFALGAVAWIVIGGIPRTIFFTRFEFIPAVTGGLVIALGIKHALMFAAVAVGVVLWRRADRLLREAEASSQS